MKIFKITILAAFLTSALSSCAFLEQLNSKRNKGVQKPLDYLEKAEKFRVNQFLKGDLKGFAIIQDENGKIIDSFTVKTKGDWEGKRGTVKYHFTYNNGKKDARTWLITVNDKESYTAIGHDFVSPAKGRQAGNVSEILYTLLKEYNGKKQNIEFEDKLYMVNSNSAIVVSKMYVKGKLVGEAIISLSKVKKKIAIKRQDDEDEEDDE